MAIRPLVKTDGLIQHRLNNFTDFGPAVALSSRITTTPPMRIFLHCVGFPGQTHKSESAALAAAVHKLRASRGGFHGMTHVFLLLLKPEEGFFFGFPEDWVKFRAEDSKMNS
jgi:hypothetical protein